MEISKAILPLLCAWLSGVVLYDLAYVQTNAALGSSVGSVTFWVDACSLKSQPCLAGADFLPTGWDARARGLHASCLCMEHPEATRWCRKVLTAGWDAHWAITLSCVPSWNWEASLRLFL